MTQDTRKDRRVKIVSLNVRYKSATVDEFIENHAHDVSRGGIYIKTANPFPAGTLLKFEIRLASDQTVITGVGRVVWKRDAPLSAGERPAGMGVKFIKVDEPSKAVIDRLVSAKTDAGKAFESEPDATLNPSAPAPSRASQPAPRPGPGLRLTPSGLPARRATAMGIGAVAVRSTAPSATSSTPAPSATEHALAPSAPSPTEAPSVASATPPAAGAALIVPARVPSVVPRPGPVPGMFPPRRSTSDPPMEGQTVIKQAAELLEEALREAGGSMDEVGNNPLFSGHGAGASGRPSIRVTDVNDDAMTARVMVAALAPAPTPKVSPAAGRPPAAPPPSVAESDAPLSPSQRPSRRAPASPPSEPKTTAAGKWLLLTVIVLGAGAGVTLYRAQIFGSPVVAEPVATPPATSSSASSPPPSAIPVQAMVPEASTMAEAAVVDAASFDGRSMTVDGAMAIAVPPVAPARPVHPRPRPMATATQLAEPSAASAATETPTAAEPKPTATAAVPTATASATAAPSPSAAPTATAEPSAKPKAEPSAKPKSKGADDSPY